MTKLFYLPIEPYETRYTADWVEQFENEFRKNNVECETILGTNVTSKINNGCVLDACGTHIYKFSQLDNLIDKINRGEVTSGDIIFVADLWFPGLESLFYIRNMTKIDFKIVGILHAGTYDKYDFTVRNGMRQWGRYLEASWLTEIDLIFVATNFHKELILSNSILGYSISSKIKVTGIPFYAQELREKYKPMKKERIVVFPHRCDVEKHPDIFDNFEKGLKSNPEYMDVKFIKTIEETKNREEYFKLLSSSSIMLSFADQETFGYSTLEAMALGNKVIVPNRLSYVETVPEHMRYNTLKEAMDMLKKSLNKRSILNIDIRYSCIDKWKKSAYNMIDEMRKEGYDV